MRLAQAHARLMFRQSVTMQDAIWAVVMIEVSTQSSPILGRIPVLASNFPEEPDAQVRALGLPHSPHQPPPYPTRSLPQPTQTRPHLFLNSFTISHPHTISTATACHIRSVTPHSAPYPTPPHITPLHAHRYSHPHLRPTPCHLRLIHARAPYRHGRWRPRYSTSSSLTQKAPLGSPQICSARADRGIRATQGSILAANGVTTEIALSASGSDSRRLIASAITITSKENGRLGGGKGGVVV